jgi:hypothetical protein
MPSVSSRSFGENGQRLRMLQRFGDPPDLRMRVRPRRALYVERSILVGDPAEQWRIFEFCLGNERRPAPPAEDQYVEPARVVGDDECVRLEPLTLNPRADAGDDAGVSQEARRPGRPA